MVEIAAGVPLVWARRDGVGVVVAAVVLGAPAVSVVLAFAGVAWLASAGVAVLLLVAVSAAGTFVLAPSSALPVSLTVASACACCPADA